MKKRKKQKARSQRRKIAERMPIPPAPQATFLSRSERRTMVTNPNVIVVRERSDAPTLTAGMLRRMLANTPDDVPIGIEVETLDNPDQYGIAYLHHGWRFIRDDDDSRGDDSYVFSGNVSLRFLPKAVKDIEKEGY